MLVFSNDRVGLFCHYEDVDLLDKRCNMLGCFQNLFTVTSAFLVQHMAIKHVETFG